MQTAQTCAPGGQQASLQTVFLPPCVSTLQPVTFHFRSTTHLAILPRHAFSITWH